MTVTVAKRRVQYVLDGVTTLFPVPFPFPAAGDLQLTRTAADGTEALLALNADYTVSGAGSQMGGSVSYPAAGPAGSRLTIKRVVSRTQLTDYVPNDPFPAQVHEVALDKLTMIAQEDADELQRGLVVPDTDPARGRMQLPPMPGRAGKFLGFDVEGRPVALTSGGADGALRTDLAQPEGAQLVGFGGRPVSFYINAIKPAEYYGAVGDGVADDIGPILNALAADNRVVFRPDATYRITQSLPLATDRKFIGEGAIILVDANVAAVANLTGASVLFAEMENLVLRANQAIGASCLALVDTSWSKFRNIRQDRAIGGASFAYFIRLFGSVSACYWNKFFDVVGTAVSAGGFRISGGSNDNRFYDAHMVNHISGYDTQRGLWLESGANNAFFGLTLEAVWNAAGSTQTHGVYFDAQAVGTIIESLRTEGAIGTDVANAFAVHWGGEANSIHGHRLLGLNSYTGDPFQEGHMWRGITGISGPGASFGSGGVQLNVPHLPGGPIVDPGGLAYDPADGHLKTFRDSTRRIVCSPAIDHQDMADRRLDKALAVGLKEGAGTPAAMPGYAQLFMDGTTPKIRLGNGTVLTVTTT